MALNCLHGVQHNSCLLKCTLTDGVLVAIEIFLRILLFSGLFPKKQKTRRAFDVELLYIAQHYNMPIKEVSVNWREIEGEED